MHFLLVPWSLGQEHSFNFSQLPGECTSLICQGAPVDTQYQPLPSQVPIGVLWPEHKRAPNSSSGVSVQQSVGSNPGRDTCVPEQDT